MYRVGATSCTMSHCLGPLWTCSRYYVGTNTRLPHPPPAPAGHADQKSRTKPWAVSAASKRLPRSLATASAPRPPPPPSPSRPCPPRSADRRAPWVPASRPPPTTTPGRGPPRQQRSVISSPLGDRRTPAHTHHPRFQARARAAGKGGKLQSQLSAQKKQSRSDAVKRASAHEQRARDADDAARARNWD